MNMFTYSFGGILGEVYLGSVVPSRDPIECFLLGFNLYTLRVAVQKGWPRQLGQR